MKTVRVRLSISIEFLKHVLYIAIAETFGYALMGFGVGLYAGYVMIAIICFSEIKNLR